MPLEKPKAVLTLPETEDSYEVTAKLYSDGSVTIMQTPRDIVCLDAERAEAIFKFLFGERRMSDA